MRLNQSGLFHVKNVLLLENGGYLTPLRRFDSLNPFHKFRRKLASEIVGEGSEDGRKTIVESVNCPSAFPYKVRIADWILVSTMILVRLNKFLITETEVFAPLTPPGALRIYAFVSLRSARFQILFIGCLILHFTESQKLYVWWQLRLIYMLFALRKSTTITKCGPEVNS